MLARSPSARASLAKHFENIAATEAEAERLLTPVHRLMAQVEAAETLLRTAEAELAAITTRESDELIKWAAAGDGERPATKQRDRQAVEGKVTLATHQLVSTRAALVKATIPLDEARSKVSELHKLTQRLVLDVLAEMTDDALDKLEDARVAAASADAKVRGLSQMLGAKGRELQSRNASPETVRALFRAAELITTRLDKIRSPEPVGREVEAQANRWAETFKRLATDPAAKIE